MCEKQVKKKYGSTFLFVLGSLFSLYYIPKQVKEIPEWCQRDPHGIFIRSVSKIRFCYQKSLNKSCLINYYSLKLNGPSKENSWIQKMKRRWEECMWLRILKGKKRKQKELVSSHQRIIEVNCIILRILVLHMIMS